MAHGYGIAEPGLREVHRQLRRAARHFPRAPLGRHDRDRPGQSRRDDVGHSWLRHGGATPDVHARLRAGRGPRSAFSSSRRRRRPRSHDGGAARRPDPRHSRGHPLVAWLDESDDARATAACRNVADLAKALGENAERAGGAGVCDPARAASERIAGALPIARALDAQTTEATAWRHRGFTLSIFATAVTALLAFVLFFRTMPPRALLGGGLAFAVALAASVYVTANIEKLPGAWLTPARIVLYVLFNAPLLLWILVPIPTSRILERASVLAPVVFPGVLVLTETHSALTEAYLLSAVLVGFALTRGIPTSTGFPWAWSRPAPSRMALYGPPLLLVSVVCIDAGNFTPAWLQAAPRAQLGMALVSLFVFAGFRQARLRPAFWGTIACTLVAAVSLALRRSAPASVCLAGWAIVSVLALVALHRRHRAYAELLAFGAYAWVSRDLRGAALPRELHGRRRVWRRRWKTPRRAERDGAGAGCLVEDPHPERRRIPLVGLRPARGDPARATLHAPRLCSGNLRDLGVSMPASCSRWCTNMRWPGAFCCSEHSFLFPLACVRSHYAASSPSTPFVRRCSSVPSRPHEAPSELSGVGDERAPPCPSCAPDGRDRVCARSGARSLVPEALPHV